MAENDKDNLEPSSDDVIVATEKTPGFKPEQISCKHNFVINGNGIICNNCRFQMSFEDAASLSSLLNEKISGDLGKLFELSKEIKHELNPVFDKIYNQYEMGQRIKILERTNKDLSSENDQLERDVAQLKNQIKENRSNLSELKHNQSGSEQLYNEAIGYFVEFISTYYNDIQDVENLDDLKKRTKFNKLFRSLSKYDIAIQYHERGSIIDLSQIDSVIDDHLTPTGNKDEDNKVISCDFGYSIGGRVVKRESVSYYKYDYKLDNNRPTITIKLHHCEPPEIMTAIAMDYVDLPLPVDENREVIGWSADPSGFPKIKDKQVQFESDIDLYPIWKKKTVSIKYRYILSNPDGKRREGEYKDIHREYGDSYEIPLEIRLEDNIILSGERKGIATGNTEIDIVYREKGCQFKLNDDNLNAFADGKRCDKGLICFGKKIVNLCYGKKDLLLTVIEISNEGEYSVDLLKNNDSIELRFTDLTNTVQCKSTMPMFASLSNIQLTLRERSLLYDNEQYMFEKPPKDHLSDLHYLSFIFKKVMPSN